MDPDARAARLERLESMSASSDGSGCGRRGLSGLNQKADILMAEPAAQAWTVYAKIQQQPMAGLGGMLGRRIAASEGGYFANRSKEALAGLRKKQETTKVLVDGVKEQAQAGEHEANADVLPEILRHSVPKGFGEQPTSSELKEPTLLKAIKSIKQPGASGSRPRSRTSLVAEDSNQMTFGPRKWQLQHYAAPRPPSTANEARTDLPVMTTAQAKAAVEAYLMIAKAFAVASTLVFSGAVVGVAWMKSHFDIQSPDDIPARGRELLLPRVERLKELFEPARSKAENMRNKWHFDEPRDGSLRSELTATLGFHQKH